MFLYGIGFRDLALLKSIKGKECRFIIDETIIQIGWKHYYLWICIESVHRVLGIHISNERNMFVAENFIRSLIDKYGKHTVTLMVVLGIQKHVRY